MFLPSPNAAKLCLGIIRSSSIGDVVLATACIDLLNHLELPITLIWVGRSPALNLIKDAFPDVVCLEIKKDSSPSELVEKLSDAHFLIDLQVSLRSKVVCRNFKKRYQRPYYSCPKNRFNRGKMVLESRIRKRTSPLPDKVLTPDSLLFKDMSDCLRKALNVHLPVEDLDRIKDFQPRPILPHLAEEDPVSWRKELKYGTWIAIAPGASFPTKRAPSETFIDILRDTGVRQKAQTESEKHPIGLLFVGDESDRKVSINILDKLGWTGPVLNLAGKLSLWQSAQALKEVSCLITNDSSLSHIAEAVKTPVAVLFGPTAEGFGFAPQLQGSRAFSANLGCRPCSKHGKTACRFQDLLCYKKLPISQICDFLESHINQEQKADIAQSQTPPLDASNKSEQDYDRT